MSLSGVYTRMIWFGRWRYDLKVKETGNKNFRRSRRRRGLLCVGKKRRVWGDGHTRTRTSSFTVFIGLLRHYIAYYFQFKACDAPGKQGDRDAAELLVEVGKAGTYLSL